MLAYSDLDAWSRSIAHLVLADAKPGATLPVVRLVVGDARTARLGELVASALALRGVTVHRSAGEPATTLVCCAPLSANAASAWMKGIGSVLDGWIGALPANALEQAHATQIPVRRVDMRTVMQAEMLIAREMHDLSDYGRGAGVMDGVAVAAGGMIAPRGTVIIDSLLAPSRVFGMADGRGLLIDSDALSHDEQQAVQTVERRVALVGV